MRKKLKICLACSAGGHLSEMLQLERFYSRHDYFFLTFERADTKSLAEKNRVFFAPRPARSPVHTPICFFESMKIISKENPDVIISTGADVGLIACIAGKLLGKKIVFIESFCRPQKPGLSGKIAYGFADLFIYQWKDLEKYYPRGVFGGSIF